MSAHSTPPYSSRVSAAQNPSRVLIFGGTFDPPHRAHIELPQAAARELGCDRIVYVPAAINPLKMSPNMPPPTPAHHRLAMLRLALRDVPNVEISTIEIDRAAAEKGPSYTIDTLRALQQESGKREGERAAEAAGAAGAVGAAGAEGTAMHLLIGADQALDFHRWKDWEEILKLATPAVMLRPPWTQASFAAALRQRYSETESRRWESWTLRTLPMIDVSATKVRRMLAEGKQIDDILPLTIQAFIHANHLYAPH